MRDSHLIDGVYVTLTDSMIAEAKTVADMRQDDALKKRRDTGRIEPEQKTRQTHYHGALAERAAKLWFDPCKWNRSMGDTYRHIPDLELPCGICLDIKWIGSRRHRLVVPCHTVRSDWYYVLVCGERHPTYQIIGWLEGTAVMKCPKEFERPAYNCVALNEIHELNEIIESLADPF